MLLDEKMKGKRLLIMFKFYHAIKEMRGGGGGCYVNQVHFGSGLGLISKGTSPIEMVTCVQFWTHVIVGIILKK